MNILIICGSLNRNSYTRVLCHTLLQKLSIGLSCQATVWDLQRQALPFHDPAYHHAAPEALPVEVGEFVEQVIQADAVVFASPIYHNSFSGVLKNAIDHLTIDVMKHKPVGLISHGGNRSPQAVDHLRIIMRGLHALAIPSQVCTSHVDFMQEEDEIAISSENILQRINLFSLELMQYTTLFSAYKTKLAT